MVIVKLRVRDLTSLLGTSFPQLIALPISHSTSTVHRDNLGQKMPRYAQFVIGPAGCGKSTYCTTIQKHCEVIQRPCHVVNLDPAAEYFEYTPIADLRDLIQVDDAMQDDTLHLGPNGGLIFCMEYLCQNLDWLDEALGDEESDYVLFDCPGQIELYSHLPVIPRLIEHLQRRWDFHIASVFILDARFLVDGSHFLSGILSALSAMVCLGTPHINVMTKLDMLSESKQRLITARYLEPNMDELCEFEDEEEIKGDHEAGDTSVTEALRKPRTPKLAKLTSMLAGVIEQYSLVHFLPLNRDKEETVEDLLFQIDQCLQYGEDIEPRNRVTRTLTLCIETIAHATTGAVFWLICVPFSSPPRLLYILESTLAACVLAVSVDVDHFIAAGSLSIAAARNLRGRPFLHWSGGLLAFAVLLLGLTCAQITKYLDSGRLLADGLLASCWVIVIAWTSHQLRDALRLGLWLWPPPDPREWVLTRPYEKAVATPPLPLLSSYPIALLCLSLLVKTICTLNAWSAESFAPISRSINSSHVSQWEYVRII
ncbi:GPN-loop GTPase 3 [Sparganum proliferum]